MSKKKIIFVLPSLGGGGAERVATHIIGSLDKGRYDISLALFEKKGPHLGDIPDSVNVYDLGKKNKFSFFMLIVRLSRLFSKIKPEAVFCLLDYSNLIGILARFLSFQKFKLIVSIRSYWLKWLNDSQRYRGIKYCLYRSFYKYADLIVFNSVDSKEHFKSIFHVGDEKMTVVYNPIDLKLIDTLKDQPIDNEGLRSLKYILAVGRLSKEKGLDHLLKAYALIHDQVQEKVLIIGDGDEKERLQLLSRELGVSDRVIFMGFQSNPYKYMRHASVFVLASLWEGFPNVLIEAMACGVPVISTDCLSGPKEVIESYKNGILVPPSDERALADAMRDLLKDEELKKRLAEAAVMKAMDFSKEKIMPEYENLFKC